jgi:hypothetical protein
VSRLGIGDEVLGMRDEGLRMVWRGSGLGGGERGEPIPTCTRQKGCKGCKTEPFCEI